MNVAPPLKRYLLRLWLVLAVLSCLLCNGQAQDVTWAVEEAPFTSAVLLKALDKVPSFTAKVEVTLSGKDEPAPSVASGVIWYDAGKLRWEVRLNDVKSPQLSQSARAAVRQINGERFLMLSRADTKANFLVLSGANACLRQPVPTVKMTRTKDPSSTEVIDKRSCTVERWNARMGEGSPRAVTLWKARSLQGAPCLAQISADGEVLKIAFKDVQFTRIPGDRFQVQVGLSQYESMEDLVQSVVLDKMKRKLGLQ